MVFGHHKDEVSLELLLPLRQVEPNHFDPCFRKLRKQVKSKGLQDPRPEKNEMGQPMWGKISKQKQMGQMGLTEEVYCRKEND